MRPRQFPLLVLVIFLMGSSCGAAYKYYTLDLPPETYDKGKLLGKLGSGGWADMPFNQCKPDEVVKGKCVVILIDEFQAMKIELQQLKQALKDCQRNCK